MKNSKLIQHLQKPIKTKNIMSTTQNPFAFGGGLKNGGLSLDWSKK
jgi:hypothetical protein